MKKNVSNYFIAHKNKDTMKTSNRIFSYMIDNAFVKIYLRFYARLFMQFNLNI